MGSELGCCHTWKHTLRIRRQTMEELVNLPVA